MKESKDYYVYEHIRKDNGTTFYIGKGRNKRAGLTERNPKHDKIAKEVGFKVNKIKTNLSEDEAYELEYETIKRYVFELGYGIDIDGYKEGKDGLFLTNRAWGDKGLRDLKRPKQSELMSGKNNPMYGINVWDNYSPTKKEDMKKKYSENFKGKNNPMYGVSPKERMDEDTYKRWFEKTHERLTKQEMSKNPNSKRVLVYDAENNYLKEFSCIKECALWFKEKGYSNSSLANIANLIGRSANHNRDYMGFHFKFNK